MQKFYWKNSQNLITEDATKAIDSETKTFHPKTNLCNSTNTTDGFKQTTDVAGNNAVQFRKKNHNNEYTNHAIKSEVKSYLKTSKTMINIEKNSEICGSSVYVLNQERAKSFYPDTKYEQLYDILENEDNIKVINIDKRFLVNKSSPKLENKKAFLKYTCVYDDTHSDKSAMNSNLINCKISPEFTQKHVSKTNVNINTSISCSEVSSDCFQSENKKLTTHLPTVINDDVKNLNTTNKKSAGLLKRSKSCEKSGMKETLRMISTAQKHLSKYSFFLSQRFQAPVNPVNTSSSKKTASSFTRSSSNSTAASISSKSGNSICSNNSCNCIIDDQGRFSIIKPIVKELQYINIKENQNDSKSDDLNCGERENSIDSSIFDEPNKIINLTYDETTRIGPSQALSMKMKEFRKDVGRQFSRFRSKSMDRINYKRENAKNGQQKTTPQSDVNLMPKHDIEYNLHLNNPLPHRQNFHTLNPSSSATYDRINDFAYNDSVHSPRIKTSLSMAVLDNRSSCDPIQCRARALVDYTPSPYDHEGLRFAKGEIIDIHAMNPNGIWKGSCGGRTGTFKFINVDVLQNSMNPCRRIETNVTNEPSWSTNYSGADLKYEAIGRPKSVQDLLKSIGFEEYTSVFILNGYEDLRSLEFLDETELDYLGIFDVNHRNSILELSQMLKDINSDLCFKMLSKPDGVENQNASGSDDDVSNVFIDTETFARDSGCYASNENLVFISDSNHSSHSDRSYTDSESFKSNFCSGQSKHAKNTDNGVSPNQNCQKSEEKSTTIHELQTNCVKHAEDKDDGSVLKDEVNLPKFEEKNIENVYIKDLKNSGKEASCKNLKPEKNETFHRNENIDFQATFQNARSFFETF